MGRNNHRADVSPGTINIKIMMKFYDKLAKWLCRFSSDKYVHFIVCLVVSFIVVRKSIDWCRMEGDAAVVVAIAFCLVAAVVKEIIDLRTKGVADVRDIAAGCVGAIVGSLMVLI